MRARLVATLLATVMTLAFMPGVASADMPLDVDCDVLVSTLDIVNDILDSNPDAPQFDSLGELVSAAKQDPALFNLLSGLILFVSGAVLGSPIDFTSVGQVVPTIAGCGGIPGLIDNIND